MKICEYTIDYKKFILLTLIFLILVDISIILKLGFLREFLSFIFLSVLPGLLLIHLFRIEIGNTEKIILSVGLSISFTLLMGILTNQISLFLGYMQPLSMPSILTVYNLLIPLMLAGSYLRNRDKTIQINLRIKEKEKKYYLIPLLFPVFALFGVLVMNEWNINLISFLVLITIPLFVILISIKKSKIHDNIYPYSLFLIGLSILIMYALRSDYIIFGADTDWEYYLYSMTLIKGYWVNFTNVTYDSCISISILPAIYQKLTGISPEYLFRVLYPLLFSISPLIIYSVARKYLGNYYSFLAAFFFISFYQFFTTNNRVDIALLFFGLLIFTMSTKKINPSYQKFLLIIFLLSIVLSHYSTAFITLGILLFTYLIIFFIESIRLLKIYQSKYGLKSFLKIITGYSRGKLTPSPHINREMGTLSIILLFFAFIFLWDSFVTGVPFDNFVLFIQKAIINMDSIFLFQEGNSVIHAATGLSNNLGIPGVIELLLSWLIIVLTMIGVLGTILQKFKYVDFLKSPFKPINQEFLVMSFVAITILMISFISPFISTGYNILRTFFQMLFILNIFFIIGSVFTVNFFEKLTSTKSKLPVRKIFIILVIISYFMCTTGTMYQMFQVDRSLSLNSHGKEFNDIFIHDQEIIGAEWLKKYSLENKTIYTDYLGRFRAIIGGLFNPTTSSVDNNLTRSHSNDYIYLRYYNVVDKRILSFNTESNITDVPLDSFNYKFKNQFRIYDNGGTQVFSN